MVTVPVEVADDFEGVGGGPVREEVALEELAGFDAVIEGG